MKWKQFAKQGEWRGNEGEDASVANTADFSG